MKKQKSYKRLSQILSGAAMAVGAIFGFFWSANRILSIVGLTVFLVAGLALLFVYAFLAKKESDAELLALIGTNDCSCVELACSLTCDEIKKHRKIRTFELTIYGKSVDVQTVVHVLEYASTSEEDVAFREAKRGTAAASLETLVQLQAVSFVLLRELYEKLQQLPECAEFLQNNQFTVFEDVWLTNLENNLKS